jgi:hypothetical protein
MPDPNDDVLSDKASLSEQELDMLRQPGFWMQPDHELKKVLSPLEARIGRPIDIEDVLDILPPEPEPDVGELEPYSKVGLPFRSEGRHCFTVALGGMEDEWLVVVAGNDVAAKESFIRFCRDFSIDLSEYPIVRDGDHTQVWMRKPKGLALAHSLSGYPGIRFCTAGRLPAVGSVGELGPVDWDHFSPLSQGGHPHSRKHPMLRTHSFPSSVIRGTLGCTA